MQSKREVIQYRYILSGKQLWDIYYMGAPADATVKKYHYDNISQAITHLDDFILAYNVGRKLSALKIQPLMQFILNKFKENPKLFNVNPNHLLLGLKNYRPVFFPKFS